MEADWQSNLIKIKHRGQYVLESGNYSDCRFLVGTLPNQRLITGHRLILAMASPVFGLMFYGSLPEKEDPIEIPDVQPDVFETMLCYIYTDEISFSSFDNACEIYYVAKKYILPHVVKQCTKFLLVYLTPKNTCRAYELAKLYEDQQLKETSMKLIVTETRKVIADPSFMDIEISTLMDILDQNRLNIESELDLFNCLLKFGNEGGIFNDAEKDSTTDAVSEYANDVLVDKSEMQRDIAAIMCINIDDDDYFSSSIAAVSSSAGICSSAPKHTDVVVEDDSTASTSGNAVESKGDVNNLMDAQRIAMNEAMLRQAVKKIRFLTMTPNQFAEGPARSKLLTQSEAFTILIKLVSPTTDDCPMPEGFCQLRESDRGGCGKNRYCISASMFVREYYNASETNARLSFQVDTNIYLRGIRIKFRLSSGQIIDRGDFSACFKNLEGTEIARTNSIENVTASQLDISFHSPVCIYHSKIYSIHVSLNNNCHFTMSKWNDYMFCNDVKFRFFGVVGFERGDLINGIIFSSDRISSISINHI